MWTRRIHSVFLFCVMLALPLTGNAQCVRNFSLTQNIPPTDRDYNHPRQMLQVTEVDEKVRPILAPTTSESETVRDGVFQHIGHAVDAESQIALSFNRSMLVERDPAANISIVGRVQSRDGTSHPIEIPGYSVIGERSVTDVAAVRSSREIFALLSELYRAWCPVEALLNQIEAGAAQSDEALERVRSLRSELQARERAYRQAVQDTLGPSMALREAEAALATEVDDSKRAEFQRTISELQSELESKRQAARTAEGAALTAQTELQTAEATGEHIAGLLSNYVDDARIVLLANRPAIENALTLFIGTGDSVLIHVFSQRMGRHPSVLATRLTQVRTVWFPRIADSAAVSREANRAMWLTAIQSVRGTIADLSRTIEELDGTDPGIFAPDLVSRLKDTEFSVAETGAKVGDRIVLEISNQTSGALPRSMEVILPVTRYGMIPGLSDSFLLLKRRHTDARVTDGKLRDAREAVESGALTEVEVRVPEDVEFTPTASVTFGWVYSHRACYRACDIPASIHRTISWLRPGLGLNVAFPTFETRYIRFTREGTTVREDTVRFDKDINIGVGVVASLFDNAIVAGYGRHLTAEDPAGYFMLGFSFVQVVEGVLRAVTN